MTRHSDRTEQRLDERSEEVYARNDAAVRRTTTRERFGGIDVPATLIGALVALAMTAILGTIAGAALGTTIFGDATLQSTDVVPAAIAGALVLGIAYFVGGWSAGRVARYSGARNGVMAALWTLLLGLAAGAAASRFGDRFDAIRDLSAPNWLARDDAVVGGAITAIVSVAIMLLFAAFGGRRGERYHARADAHLSEPRVSV